MQLISKAKYESVLNFTNKILPDAILVHLWIKVRVTGKPAAFLNSFLFADTWPNPNALCAIDKGLHPSQGSSAWSCFWSRLDDDRTLKFLQELNETMKLSEVLSLVFFGIADYHARIAETVFGRNGTKYGGYPIDHFWITPEKQKMLMQTKIDPPEGYYFDTLKTEDAKFVDDMWPHNRPGSLARMKHRIENFPNVALRVNGTQEIAAFEIVHDQHGYMNHLYTVEKHRRTGLATKVEEKLSQLIMAQGYVPYKLILQENIAGQTMVEINPWWDTIGYVELLAFVKEANDDEIEKRCLY